MARLNDYEIKVVKVEGEFVWHTHEDTDELFLVLAGVLTIQLRDRNVVLGPGQLFVVPRGEEHCPIAEGEVHALLIEPAGVDQYRRHRRPVDGRSRRFARLTPTVHRRVDQSSAGRRDSVLRNRHQTNQPTATTSTKLMTR